MSITRYEIHGYEWEHEEDDDGQWVKCTDHTAAIAERDHALKKMSEQYAEAVGKIDRLAAEVERYREAIRAAAIKIEECDLEHAMPAVYQSLADIAKEVADE